MRTTLQGAVPEKAEGFTERATGPFMEFFEHYANVLTELDDVIRKHL